MVSKTFERAYLVTVWHSCFKCEYAVYFYSETNQHSKTYYCLDLIAELKTLSVLNHDEFLHEKGQTVVISTNKELVRKEDL